MTMNAEAGRFLKKMNMSGAEIAIELLKLVLPAVFVLYGMFLTVKAFLSREADKIMLENKGKNTEVVLPIRLQAYERLSLLLERIYPNNLLVRLNDSSYSAKDFQGVLLREIREEFNHNLSQQIYVSEIAWNKVKNAIESINTVINECGLQASDEDRGIDLAKLIFEKVIEWQSDPVQEALHELKTEISREF